MEKNITFIIGAGAETSKYKLPSGPTFKKNIILSKNAKSVFELLNKKTFKIIDGILLRYNANSTLYQTLTETQNNEIKCTSIFNDNVIKNYMNYKKNNTNEDKNKISKKFQNLFKRNIYDALKNNKTENEILKFYLENLSFCSYVDSLFNYLRDYNMYPKECSRVVKLYFSAFLSIVSKLGVDDDFIDENKNNDILTNRMKLNNLINDSINKIIDKEQKERNSRQKKCNDNDLNYYVIIKDLISEIQKEKANKKNIYFITTNYTEICQRVININNDDIAYVHGKLDLFENLDTKEIKHITEFNENDIIFPYLMIQSGIKPIISPYQLNEWFKAICFVNKSKYVVLIGYGINSDDEHITNVLRYYVKDRKILIFIYSKYDEDKDYISQKNKILNIFKNNTDNFYFYKTSEFKHILNCIIKDEIVNSSI
ncbi:MAG: hypothetical protein BHW12_03945 [Coprobacillus sp. 28_7]|nr:MAG: hypothetical protein BHW12_03945 [Coprobacillus sp. 28_7]